MLCVCKALRSFVQKYLLSSFYMLTRWGLQIDINPFDNTKQSSAERSCDWSKVTQNVSEHPSLLWCLTCPSLMDTSCLPSLLCSSLFSCKDKYFTSLSGLFSACLTIVQLPHRPGCYLFCSSLYSQCLERQCYLFTDECHQPPLWTESDSEIDRRSNSRLLPCFCYWTEPGPVAQWLRAKRQLKGDFMRRKFIESWQARDPLGNHS